MNKYVDVPRYNHREKVVEVPKVLVVERIIPVLKTVRKETIVYGGEDVSALFAAVSTPRFWRSAPQIVLSYLPAAVVLSLSQSGSVAESRSCCMKERS